MRQSHLYSSIKYCTEEYNYPIEACCRILRISRSAYYKWLRGDVGDRVIQNRLIADKIEEIHMKDPSKGLMMTFIANMASRLTISALSESAD